MNELVAYRHAAYDSPWWANANSRSGRFHRALDNATQYLSLHPLGPAAEMLRHHVGPDAAAVDLDTVLLNLWAVIVDARDIVHISFDDCAGLGISPDELVGDDHGPTQDLAERLRRDGTFGIRVPSAALPGTDNLVLFGPRILHPYLQVPITPEEVPTGHLTDGARPPAEVASIVRWLGAEHSALREWQSTGTYPALDDPIALRW